LHKQNSCGTLEWEWWSSLQFEIVVPQHDLNLSHKQTNKQTNRIAHYHTSLFLFFSFLNLFFFVFVALNVYWEVFCFVLFFFSRSTVTMLMALYVRMVCLE
jgi:hypothetical protein